MSNNGSITVQREIPSSAKEIFDVLSNPHRHTELDGSGFIQGLEKGDRLEKVGQKFTVNMNGPHMGGDYKTDNFVSAFDPDKMIGWKTAPAGSEPPGWEWLWELRSEGSGSTLVSLTYDWSKVTDPDLLSKISFPLVSEHELETSLGKLTEATTGS
ncbi:SRPBCC family protein [soil metagenome]